MKPRRTCIRHEDRKAVYPQGNPKFCSLRCAAAMGVISEQHYQWCEQHHEWYREENGCFGCEQEAQK